MENEKVLKKIIWAVNPFDEITDVQAHVAAVLAQLSAKTNAVVEPVSLLPRWESLSKESSNDYRGLLEKELKALVRKYTIPHLKDPYVLIKEVNSVTQAAKALDRYAQKENADLIALGTHGRKGIPRFLLGSFAETLLLNATSPVLIASSKSEAVKPIKHILFATDFTEGSERIFKTVIGLAKELDSKITVFHALRPLVDPGIPYGMPFFVNGSAYDDCLKEIEQGAANTTKKLAEKAAASDVKAEVFVDPSVMNVADAIAEHAQKNDMGLIAMAAQSNAIETTLLGSVTRQVVRRASVPVWIMRDKIIKK